MKNNFQKSGGSIASQHVMSAFKQQCNANMASDAKVQFNVREIINNYGSEYKTTGGSLKQLGGDIESNIESFLEKVIDNRVLDIYLKYLGITLLTPATLVPIALIMGKNVFEKVVEDIKMNDKQIQLGGKGFLDVKIPILDDNVVGTGLKIAGITALTVTPYTLVPLAVLMYVYNVFEAEKKRKEEASLFKLPFLEGGKDSISFGNSFDFGHPKQPNLDWTDKGTIFQYKGGKKSKKRAQNGGTRYITGSAVPINPFQYANAVWNSEPVSATRYVDYVNDELQMRTQNDGSIQQVNLDVPYHQQIKTLVTTPSSAVCGMTEGCAIPPNSMAGGASSDWKSTNYSAGPINQPPMDECQFRAFNQTNLVQ